MLKGVEHLLSAATFNCQLNRAQVWSVHKGITQS